jgi:hypothetical protein
MFFRNRKPVIVTIDDKFPSTEDVSNFELGLYDIVVSSSLCINFNE